MARWLRTYSVLPEDLPLIIVTHMGRLPSTYNSSFGASQHFWPGRHLHPCMYLLTHVQFKIIRVKM